MDGAAGSADPDGPEGAAAFKSALPRSWHLIHIRIPLPSTAHAALLVRALSPDVPLRSPALVRRHFAVSPASASAPAAVEVHVAAVTVRQARVMLTHLLEDVELVVGAMEELGPEGMKRPVTSDVEIGAK